MKVDIRDKWQNEAVECWNNSGGKGSIVACTGAGKGFAALKIIKRYLKVKSDAIIHIITPTKPIQSMWDALIKEHIKTNINYEVVVINTYVKTSRACDLLILDESHNFVATSFRKVLSSPHKYILTLSATLERKDGLEYLIKMVAPVIYELSLKKARKLGFVSDYQIYNLGVDFDDESKAIYAKAQNSFNFLFSKFAYNFELAMACMTGKSEYINQVASELGITYKEVQGMGAAWGATMRKRNTLIYVAPAKLKIIKQLIDKIEGKVLIFSKTTDFCDEITNVLGPTCKSYHSKIKTQIIDGVKVTPKKYKTSLLYEFEHGDVVNELSAAKGLEEGVSVDNVLASLIASYDSDVRGFIQKAGRALRLAPGKKALIICLYMKPFYLNKKLISSKEQNWLKASQKGIESSVKWVDSIDEIFVKNSVSF